MSSFAGKDRSPERIVIAEDSMTQAVLLKNLLEENGYKVIHCVNGKAALEEVRKSAPSLVISDVMMPEMDGYTLCERIKADAGLKEIPFILLTVLSSSNDIVKGLQCGADNFLRKPVEAKNLLSRVETILANRKLKGEKRLEMELEISLEGKKYHFNSQRQQILDLLIMTYEQAVHLNRELEERTVQLEAANKQLEVFYASATSELRESEIRQKLVLNTLPIALYNAYLEEKYKIQWVSENISSFTGFSFREFVEKPDFWVSRIHPEDREKVLREYASIRSKGSCSIEYRWQCAAGRYRWFLDQAMKAPNQKGKGIQIVGSWLDISERKELEQQYQQAQKMESLGQLAGGVAHDFNNMLTVIKGFSELIEENSSIGAALRQHAKEISRSADRASELTRKLLAFSRKQTIERRVISLNNVVVDMDLMLKRLIGPKIIFQTVPSPDLWPVKVDPGQMEQLLMNLVVNARDAMSQGGTLAIETTNVDVDESYVRQHVDVSPGQYVLLTVSDTGSGMDEKTKTHLFEPFFTTKEKGKGSGLGLATVFGIVKQSGGMISVYSEAGKGTAFKVYLPRAISVEKVAPSPAVKPLRALKRGNETILVVEDEDGVRALAREVLSRNGYQVLEANNSGQAYLVFKQHKGVVHLLLSDFVMPGIEGPELAVQLYRMVPDLKVLFTSGYTEKMFERVEKLEFRYGFIAKPFSTSELLVKVREILDSPR